MTDSEEKRKVSDMMERQIEKLNMYSKQLFDDDDYVWSNEFLNSFVIISSLFTLSTLG